MSDKQQTRNSSVKRNEMSDAKYIKALEDSNRTLSVENRRLVGVLIAQLNHREKEADRCAKCLLNQQKKISHE
jgi:hypothetical protein